MAGKKAASKEGLVVTRKAPRRAAKESFRFASAGKYTEFDEDGSVKGASLEGKIRAVRSAARATEGFSKQAGLFSDGELGPANIADSNNIGMYSYEFPVDSMELPASRAEELRFYRLAVDRDPIVGHAIDLHATIPVSKMALEKPKCSVQEFSDYVYDFYERLVGDAQFFSTVVEAIREYMQIGEAFLHVEEPELKIEYSKVSKDALGKGRGSQAGLSPTAESDNAPMGGSEGNITKDFVSGRTSSVSIPDTISTKSKRSWLQKQAKKLKVTESFQEFGIVVLASDKLEDVEDEIEQESIRLSKMVRAGKLGLKTASFLKTAEPGDAPIPESAVPSTDAPIDATPGDTPPDSLTPEEGGDIGTDLSGGGGFGGGGGGFGGGGLDDPMAADPSTVGDALSSGEDAEHRRRMSDLKRYLHLLEIKKQMLEDLNNVVEKKNLQKEIFSHVENEGYEGFTRIQMLPPEQIEITNGEGNGVNVYYKPSEEETASYLDDASVDASVREGLEESGQIELNQDPYTGSYVIHFARKKAGYELHGRSILQRCIRCIIYREKLRQVQTTLASRNMTPKTLLTAPGVSAAQVAELRAHADEAKADPDYTIVTNYEVTWEEIGSEGRLLSLADEWSHTNSDLAIGLGFSPEILIGEGMYSNSRVMLDLMSTMYVQLRQNLSDVIENKIFKPIAIKKGFYEMDNYGRPRWIYPKITFGRLALRDSGDLYDSLLNLYSKGSLPVSVLYELLDLDPETMERELSEDLYTVRDSKFNEILSSVYNGMGEALITKTDILSKVAQGLQLKEEEPEDDSMEGSGAGL